MKIIVRMLSGPLAVVLAVGCGSEPIGEPSDGTPVAAEVPAVPDFPCRDWQPLDGGTDTSFRGLSAVSDEVVWVSGTGGTWGRTLDGGETWAMGSVPGAEELDFRDVDAVGDQAAYLMSAGPGELSRIYKTADGGESWQLQLTNPAPEGFFDGMAFWSSERGVLYGDPVGGRFYVLATEDGGATWTRVPAEDMPPALEGEAGFAASGSGIAVTGGGHAWFGTGGPEARVFRSSDHGGTWTVAATPMLAGTGSTGIFSLAFASPLDGVAVGGDYTQPEETAGNAARTTDGGLTWELIEGSPPAGYRSGVAYAPSTGGRVLIAAGTSGSDLSLDGGATWTPLGSGSSHAGGPVEHFNAVRFGSSPCAAWTAGPEGSLARLTKDEAPETAAPEGAP